ncbi:MAG: UrcA family protein [Allosphingosinicella sp.]|uniref:UrcA family protein n=1 Tax=Allosphingosinicella sp. TaxID=2823234 RepID=UPI0039260F95
MIVRNAMFALAACCAAAVATGLAAGPAAAQDVGGLQVRHADLNLASPAGRAALDRRIAFAAEQACGDPWTDLLVMQRLARKCQDDAVAAARPQRDALLSGERFAAITVRRAHG